MKKFNKIFMSMGVAATAFGFASCVDDLNMQPIDPNQTTDVSSQMAEVLTDIYLNFASEGNGGNSPVKDFDGGMAVFQRAIFTAEEMPTDEACWLWDPSSFGEINYGRTVPTLDCVFGFYSRLMINITLCNQFIQSVDNGTFVLTTDTEKAAAEQYKLQARTMRGLCYYYMMSFYDNIPYADENTEIGAMPEQLPRAEVYARVTTDLEDVVASFPANQVPFYGFVGLDAAESVLAKIYLNGEVWSGTGDYAKCYEHCQNIIKRLGNGGRYGNGLAYSYQSLFGANNDQFVLGRGTDVREIIWTLPQDIDGGQHLISWAGATFMTAAWLGTNGVSVTVPCPTMDSKYANVTDTDELLFMDGDSQRVYKYFANQADYDDALATYKSEDTKDWMKTVNEVINNIAYSFDPSTTGYVSSQWFNCIEGWKCVVARKSFVRKFEWDDVEMTRSNDTRVANWQTSAHGFTVDNPSLIGDDWGNNGYLAPKYTNWAYNADGTINYLASPEPTSQLGGDYAVIRLAEIYLTAAEAILNGGGGSQAEALQYVNYIRQRAYGDTDHNWTSLSMQDLRDERCRELYQENVRRTDLIRWNQWCTGYTWEWKGGVASGTNLPEYTKCYPIPSRVITSSNFQQIKGY
ncbi:MAG: RagB/SusD family nutrient uptake outer membrane protein [Muribaculaceae bacterium]|nr:RagB/SusD family nutrient uptake outer membrane protein [Muribaculaceae bacterium]